VPVKAYAVRGALVDAGLTHPAELGRWIVGLAALHDVVLVSIVLALGVALRRRVPRGAWPAVRAALLASAVLRSCAGPSSGAMAATAHPVPPLP
jgi:hypothetical protein